MITKLREGDRERILNYLSKESSLSLFLIADIESYGFDSEQFEVWAIRDEGTGSIEGAFCRYYSNLVVYSVKKTISAAEICKFLAVNNLEFKTILGKDALIKCFYPYISFRAKHQLYFAALTKNKFKPLDSESVKIEAAGEEDALQIHELRNTIEEFKGLMLPLKQLQDFIKTGKGRVYFIRERGEIVSSAASTAETACFAQIGAVCTKREARRKGYASLLVSKLSGDLLAEGKTCCLGYENPAAGRIYARLGYKKAGKMIIGLK